MTIIVSPSLLACDFLNIEAELKAFESAKDIWLHLDIMDGHFVPNLTFGHSIIKKISQNTHHPLDAHFMVNNPEFYVETLKDIPLYNFTFHLEACKEPIQLLKEAKIHYPSVGLSIRPGTKVETLSDELLSLCDLILVMSVEPGFGGQSFMPNSLDKILWLKEKRKTLKFNFQIQIDGGINAQTAKDAISAGVDNLVAGSYIFKAGADHYSNQIDNIRFSR